MQTVLYSQTHTHVRIQAAWGRKSSNWFSLLDVVSSQHELGMLELWYRDVEFRPVSWSVSSVESPSIRKLIWSENNLMDVTVSLVYVSLSRKGLALPSYHRAFILFSRLPSHCISEFLWVVKMCQMDRQHTRWPCDSPVDWWANQQRQQRDPFLSDGWMDRSTGRHTDRDCAWTSKITLHDINCERLIAGPTTWHEEVSLWTEIVQCDGWDVDGSQMAITKLLDHKSIDICL